MGKKLEFPSPERLESFAHNSLRSSVSDVTMSYVEGLVEKSRGLGMSAQRGDGVVFYLIFRKLNHTAVYVLQTQRD